MRPEDQHYVPAGYLRSFPPYGEGALFVHRRQGTKWFRQVPENIATRKNFYSILREDGTFDDRIEHMLARGIERPGLAALWRLKEGQVIPSWDTRESIAIFLAVQYTRIPDTVCASPAVAPRIPRPSGRVSAMQPFSAGRRADRQSHGYGSF
jgi:Protein of unknown function (DUF4238)